MTQAARLALCYDRDVHNLAKLLVIISEYISNPPLDLIATDSIANLATHSYSQTGKILARVHYHNEMGSVITLPLYSGSFIIACTAYATELFEGMFTFHPLN